MAAAEAVPEPEFADATDAGDTSDDLLRRSVAGDQDAARRLAPLVYDNLRRLASARLAGSDWTCQPTAIVHEAYLRMADQTRADVNGRTHFLALAAEMVRRVIADEARHRGRQKRGGGWQRVTLTGIPLPSPSASGALDGLGLEEALGRLQQLDPRGARVVELRFFGGLTEPETAAVIGVSERTVRNDWRAARAWLRRELEGRDPDEVQPDDVA